MSSETRRTEKITFIPKGPFSLRESVEFGFGQRDSAEWDGKMRLAFCLDDLLTHAGVLVEQDEDGVHLTVSGTDHVEQAARQATRVLSLNVDATTFEDIGDRDPVLRELQNAAPGLRPPLFYSAYEAAAWSVLSARRPHRQMMALRQRFTDHHGPVFEIAGESLSAFPDPATLLEVESFPGLPEVKLERLHGVARAALDGRLDTEALLELDPEVAMSQLQQIPGIGPFYSSLVVIRALGHTDVLAPDEPKVRDLARRLYGLQASPDPAAFAVIAEPWKPWRTWASVLLRAAGSRILSQ